MHKKWTEAAKKIRSVMNTAGAMLTDEQSLTVPDLFAPWNAHAEYALGERCLYNDILYRCINAHAAQEAWNPADAPSLWAKVLIPDPDVIPEWEQPDSTNAYKLGDKVTHNGKTWVCTEVDGAGNNTWEPGVYGWTEVTE